MAISPENSVAASNPGSYNDFLKAHDLEGGSESIEGYSEALHVYRLALAAELGVTLDDLHDTRYRQQSSDQAA